MYPRFAERRLREALADTPVVAITGPRQAGKTTLARGMIGAANHDKRRTYLTLDDATTLAAARADPAGFVRDLDHAVIDEVQRAPELLLAIKRSVDEDRRPGRFLLTGSANIRTIPTVQESLAGRIEIIPLLSLSRSEMIGGEPAAFLDRAFRGEVPMLRERLVGEGLVAAVLAGGYPEVIARTSERRRRDWCRAYLDAIVERDIPDIATLEKAGQMPRLLEVLAQQAGQLTNFSEIGGHIGLDRKTTDRYLTVLEQLFLVRRLRPWFCNELKRLIRTPKLHFIDTGLLATLRGPSVSRERLRVDRKPLGALLESYVFAELLKQASWSDERPRFSHYRDKDGVEVDIVAENEEGGVVGIEVKAGATVTAQDFQGLHRLASATKDAFRLGVVLYDGDLIVPFGERLRAAPLASLWS